MYSGPNVFFVLCAILDLGKAIDDLFSTPKWTVIRKKLLLKDIKRPSDLLVKVSKISLSPRSHFSSSN